MWPYTNQEWDKLLHVMITHEADWDPRVLDNELSCKQNWYDSQPSTQLLFPLFNEQGNLCPHIVVQQHATHINTGDSINGASPPNDSHGNGRNLKTKMATWRNPLTDAYTM